MSKSMKIWFIIASSVVIVGLLLFSIVMTVLRWDFSKLTTVSYEKNDYTISGSYRDISIIADTADIEFVQSKEQKTTVICYEESRARHSVQVIEDCLEIRLEDSRKWYEHININYDNPKITVILPNACGEIFVKANTGDVILPDDFTFDRINVSVSTGDVKCSADTLQETKIKSSTGDIDLFDSHCGKLVLCATTGEISIENTYCDSDVNIDVTTGKTYVNDLYADHFTSTGSTGDILLKRVTPITKISIIRSTGDVTFEKCDAPEIFVQTDTGDVKGTLLSEKTFVTSTDTGRIDVSKSASGGKCEIITDTGDIKISVEK